MIDDQRRPRERRFNNACRGRPVKATDSAFRMWQTYSESDTHYTMITTVGYPALWALGDVNDRLQCPLHETRKNGTEDGVIDSTDVRSNC